MGKQGITVLFLSHLRVDVGGYCVQTCMTNMYGSSSDPYSKSNPRKTSSLASF